MGRTRVTWHCLSVTPSSLVQCTLCTVYNCVDWQQPGVEQQEGGATAAIWKTRTVIRTITKTLLFHFLSLSLAFSLSISISLFPNCNIPSLPNSVHSSCPFLLLSLFWSEVSIQLPPVRLNQVMDPVHIMYI